MFREPERRQTIRPTKHMRVSDEEDWRKAGIARNSRLICNDASERAHLNFWTARRAAYVARASRPCRSMGILPMMAAQSAIHGRDARATLRCPAVEMRSMQSRQTEAKPNAGIMAAMHLALCSCRTSDETRHAAPPRFRASGPRPARRDTAALRS